MSTLDTPTGTPEHPVLRIPKSANPAPTATAHVNRKVPVLAYVAILLAVIGVLVVGSQTVGWFKTTGQMTSSTGEKVAPAAGAATSDIKGWMSIQQVMDAYPVTKDALYAHFGIPTDIPTTATLSELKEAGTGTLDVPTLRSWIDDGAPA